MIKTIHNNWNVYGNWHMLYPKNITLKYTLTIKVEYVVHSWTTYCVAGVVQYWKPAHEGDSPSKGGLSPSWGFFSLCLCITIYRRKNQNCKKRQWCLFEGSNSSFHVSSLHGIMHQFIEISICALENKIYSNILMSSDPWKSVCQRVCPCTAAKTIGRTKLPSSVWEEKKIRGFPYQSGKPAHEGGPPQEGGRSPSWGFVSLCITIYRWKNHFCKKLQWCLWRFMYPLSFHQFIEISIVALKK